MQSKIYTYKKRNYSFKGKNAYEQGNSHKCFVKFCPAFPKCQGWLDFPTLPKPHFREQN